MAVTPVRLGYLVLLALLLEGCSRGGSGGPGGPGGGFAPPPMPVEIVSASRQSVADRFEAVGTIEAADAVVVVSEIDGVVRSLPFPEGGRVAKGDVIARLDDEQLRAEVDRAAALRDQEKATFDRVQSVVSQGAGSPQDLDDAAARLKVAEAELALAASRLDKTRLVAPFAGMIGARRVSPGAFVRAGEPITDLVRVSQLRIVFSAPERYFGQIRRGANVSVATTAFPGEELSGIIDVVEPALDPGTRSTRVIALADNPDDRFRPGMSARVTAILSERPDALTIPSEAVFVEGGQTFVFSVQPDSTVQRTPVTLGTRLPDVVEVVDGLATDAKVVRAGHQKLFPGARIFPVGGAPQGAGQ